MDTMHFRQLTYFTRKLLVSSIILSLGREKHTVMHIHVCITMNVQHHFYKNTEVID